MDNSFDSLEQLAACQCDCRHLSPLSGEKIESYLHLLGHWVISPSGYLQRSIKTNDFLSSFALAEKVVPIAEELGHHPDLTIKYGALEIVVFTHSIKALSLADFVLAARLSRLF
ncbi:MAG: 4a-hydroxytetrahydrobiopterin dehydratase [Candidatus Obscuribacterales bacterium]|nr:4a-hydroxytetrahydrobiopterin dehydratase [Candidatus Obscuribacterales bacterium]